MTEAAVRAVDLTKRFGDFTAVDHVNFEVYRGEILGYLGPNGSGKTTTIRLLLGLLLMTEGSAEVLGYDAATQTEQIRARVGYMSQKFALYDDLTAWENLEFYAGVYGVAEGRRVDNVIARVGLEAIMDEPAGKLPIGWRQRLALATAIVHQPPLLILDEPTSGVDPVARRAFWDLINELADEGATIFVTTHYMDEAEYCHRIGIMQNGRLMAMGPPVELKRKSLPGEVWSVEGQPLLDVLRQLESNSDVLHVALAGNRLRAISRPGVSGRDLRRKLRSAGIKSVAIESAEPTLEDVFLVLSGAGT
ncbi:MAG: ABC transporter ATP-binding protein [Anaerolineales bacterium]|jgi:ABC-2 type transport system ATP-binding protein